MVLKRGPFYPDSLSFSNRKRPVLNGVEHPGKSWNDPVLDSFFGHGSHGTMVIAGVNPFFGTCQSWYHGDDHENLAMGLWPTFFLTSYDLGYLGCYDLVLTHSHISSIIYTYIIYILIQYISIYIYPSFIHISSIFNPSFLCYPWQFPGFRATLWSGASLPPKKQLHGSSLGRCAHLHQALQQGSGGRRMAPEIGVEVMVPSCKQT